MDVSSGGRDSAGVSRPETFETLIIEKVMQWCPEAEAGLCDTFGNDRELIILGVQAGTLELWKLWDGAAWAVTRIDLGVLTCCCYQGVHCATWMQWLMSQGKRMQLTAIQFYTARRGLARLLGRFGFTAQETVYRAPIL